MRFRPRNAGLEALDKPSEPAGRPPISLEHVLRKVYLSLRNGWPFCACNRLNSQGDSQDSDQLEYPEAHEFGTMCKQAHA